MYKNLKSKLLNEYTIFFLGLVIVVISFYGYINRNLEPAEIGQVIGAQEMIIDEKGNTLMKYAYVAGAISNEPSENIVKEAQKIGVEAIKENTSMRTKHSKTFVTNIPDVFITEIISGVPQYYQDDTGNWWQADYTTSTPEEFSKLPKTPLYARLTDTSKFAFVKRAFADTSTFYPDPDPETSTVDGTAIRGVGAGESFSAIRSSVGTSNIDNTSTGAVVDISASADSGNPWDNMRRGIFGFDTSPVPDTASISSATFSIDGTARSNFYSQSVVVDRKVPTTANDIANGDYDVSGWGGIEQASNRITIASWSTTAYNDFTLNSTGIGNISKTGISWFGLRLSGDFDNSEPSPWQSVANATASGNFAERTDTTQDPKLVMVYTVPSSGSIFNQDVIFNQEVIFK